MLSPCILSGGILTEYMENVIIFKYRAKGVRYAHYHADTKGGAVRV